jgi:sulfur carrier protein
MKTLETIAAVDTPIAVTLNGAPCRVSAGTPLGELLGQHPETTALAPQAYACAVNGAFVARAKRERHVLQAGDAVTVFQAIVGG